MRIIKVLTCFLLMMLYLLSSVIILIFVLNKRNKRYIFTRNTSFFSKSLIKLFNIRILLSEKELLNLEDIRLIVSNHLSWLDIIIISSLKPCFFITSYDIKNNYFLGPFAQFAGSFFVDRKRHTGLKNEIFNLSQAVQSYYPICLFPEATSSNGEQVLAFKNALFHSFLSQNTAILSIVINYLSLNYESISSQNRDQIFWYGDMGFFSSLLSICACREITVNIKPLSVTYTKDFNTRKDLSLHLYQQINAEFLPVV